MAFKLFSRLNRRICFAIALLYLLSNNLFAQNAVDLSARTSHGRKASWISVEHLSVFNSEKETGKYDKAVSQGATILFKTQSPAKYARQTEILSAELKDWKGVELRSGKGVQLLTLQPDQLISLQSLLMGKVYDPTFLRQEILYTENLSQSSLNRELLSQVLALQLNRMVMKNELLEEFRIEFDSWLVTQQMDFSGKELSPGGMPCGNGMDSRVVYSWKFPTSLQSILGTDNTVRGLQDLAVEVLAGSRSVSKSQVEDILQGVRIINEAFESGRYLLGWSDQFITCSNSWILRWKIKTPALEVPVREDSYTTRASLKTKGGEIRLEVDALESSRVLIELYTERGSRIKKFYHDRLDKGAQLSFLIDKTGVADVLIYKVTAEGRTYSGLIP
ncbi:hypothetical protein L0U88_08700 [Flavihumibacter sp. RY-1]|uniref:GLPGLI family protein n=1 Tax=Flavihumibacter fluminis TaxID=2909236 RepID=A0ABS9BG81_9BACT|nr:hypothetical protein [Flavihumibacter fluminis]MCF1714702.1 hypothetical protein [Flavihumibacter fluminis]